MTAGQQLGALLIDMGFIDEAQLESALDEQSRSGLRLGRILVRAGIITEERLVHALSRQLGIEPCDPIMTPIHSRVLALVPPALAFKHHVLPIARQREETRDCLYVATSDPLDKAALQALRAVVGTNTRVRWMLAGETEMELALARHYGNPPRPSSDIPVIQGRPVSGPVDRTNAVVAPSDSGAFAAPPISGTPARGQSTQDIAAALSVAMGESPLPAARLQSLGSRDLLPLSTGEVSDDILVAEDVVESGAFPAMDDLHDAVHRPAEVNLDEALAAAFADEMASAPPPLEAQGTQQSGLATSSPFGRDAADQAIEDAFAGFRHDGATSEGAAVDAALAGTSTDAGVATNAPGETDDEVFPPPDGGAFDEAFDAGFEPVAAFDAASESYPRANGAASTEPSEAPSAPEATPAPLASDLDAPTSIPAPTAPEPAAHEVDTGPSWGDLLDSGSAWSGSLTPSSSSTASAPPEPVEIPEPADSSLPTMIAEPATPEAVEAVETVEARDADEPAEPEDVPLDSIDLSGDEPERDPNDAIDAIEVAEDAAVEAPEEVAIEVAEDAPVEAPEEVAVDESEDVAIDDSDDVAFAAGDDADDESSAEVDAVVAAADARAEAAASGALGSEPSPEARAVEEVEEDPEPIDDAEPIDDVEPIEPDDAIVEVDAASLGGGVATATIDVEDDAPPPRDEDAAPSLGGVGREAFGLDAVEADAEIDAPPEDDASDAPLPIGPDALAAAERALRQDEDDLPDASADIELAEAPPSDGLATLVERFAAGDDLEDADLQLVMRGLAAALLELGAFEDERFEAIARRLGLT